MAESAALLADEILPPKPLRQWVLSLLIERILAHVRQRSEADLPLPLGARGPPPVLL
jgi:hypothetical protein